MFVLGKVLWFLLTPSNSLTLLALYGSLSGLFRKTSRAAMAVVAFSAVGLLVCGLSPLGFWLATPLEARFPQPRPMPAKVAGIVVLGGALRPYDTQESGLLTIDDAGDRLIALGDLARRYPLAKIVMSGGSGDLFEEGEVEAELVRRHADTLGVEPSRIIAEKRSRTTYENALYARELAQPGEGEVWLLVTSAWHMPRAVGTFRQAGFPVTAYPVDFRATGPRFAWRMLPSVTAGLRLTDLMTKEWVGLAAYRLMGRTDALMPGPDPS